MGHLKTGELFSTPVAELVMLSWRAIHKNLSPYSSGRSAFYLCQSLSFKITLCKFAYEKRNPQYFWQAQMHSPTIHSSCMKAFAFVPIRITNLRF